MRKNLVCLLAILVIGGTMSMAQPEIEMQSKDIRSIALDMMNKRKIKEAYAIFFQLAMNPDDDAVNLSTDLKNLFDCMYRIKTKKIDDIDDIREKLSIKYSQNWRVLFALAKNYNESSYLQGYILSGKFSREQLPDSKMVTAYESDRVRAIQLMVQAEKLIAGAPGKEAGKFYIYFSDIFLNLQSHYGSHRFNSLLDITRLPDYPEYSKPYYRYGIPGTPVDAAGNPIYYAIPASWENAKNDGERWRWLLKKAGESDAESADDASYRFAYFAYRQFYINADDNPDYSLKPGYIDVKNNIFNIRTLTDNETIARFTTGVKRFNLPEEYNYIKLFNAIAEGNGKHQEEANRLLAIMYMKRHQYDKALIYFKRIGNDELINLITGNQGEIDVPGSQTAGKNAEVKFLFMNGNEVHFTASPINFQKLLIDMKDKKAKINLTNSFFEDMGYLLANQKTNEKGYKRLNEYIGAAVAEWDLQLAPKPGYADSIITVKTPLTKAGIYLLTSTMKNGNTSHGVVCIADTAVIFKPLKNAALLFAADAATGKGLGNTEISFFGYTLNKMTENQLEQAINNGEGVDEGIREAGAQEKLLTFEKEFTTNENGQLIIPVGSVDYQWVVNMLAGSTMITDEVHWVVTIRNGDRFSFMPFDVFNQPPWNGVKTTENKDKTKEFIITDRPVYRPGDTVKFKAWVNTAEYNQEGKSSFAGKQISVKIYAPDRTLIFDKSIIADNYGGVTGEVKLKPDASFGGYVILINNSISNFNGVPIPPEINVGIFEVIKDIKKPQFDVTVETPKESIKLGDTTTIKIKAKYSNATPVTDATVRYKIFRSDYTPTWYPAYQWDWLYNNGYSWFPCDYEWYPGWNEWGTPLPVYIDKKDDRQYINLENISAAEVPIGPDGTLEVTINTKLAKEMHGNTDHKYSIIAIVADQTDTEYNLGEVIAVRKPFTVYAWANKGYYRTGNQIQANFNARTVNGKPVKGTGEVKLLKISYKDGNPTETPVFTQPLDTDDNGTANIQLKAGVGGQYRLSYTVTNAEGSHVEGGYIFTVYADEMKSADFRFNGLEIIPDKREYQPGDNVNLLINTEVSDCDVLLFTKPANDVNSPPKIIKMKGKSAIVSIPVTGKDIPNFFIEAVAAGGGEIFNEVREIAVPPMNKSLKVEILPPAARLKSGESATVKLKVTDPNGKPVQGQAVVTVYDKAAENFNDLTKTPDIKKFFWNWRHYHQPYGVFNLSYYEEISRSWLDEPTALDSRYDGGAAPLNNHKLSIPSYRQRSDNDNMPPETILQTSHYPISDYLRSTNSELSSLLRSGGIHAKIPAMRTEIADTAFWTGALETAPDGTVEFTFKMPENMAGWKMKCWVMGAGGAVGEAEAEGMKTVLLKTQAPKYLTQNDEVILSADIHNYLNLTKKVKVVLESNGSTLISLDEKEQTIDIPANSDKQVNFRVKAVEPGQAIVRIKAVTDEDSDVMEMKFPVQIHATKKSASYSGMIQPEGRIGNINVMVPADGLPNHNRLVISWSPTIAGVMVDALPSLYENTINCTEGQMNKFVPMILVQNSLKNLGFDLKAIKDKRSKFNLPDNYWNTLYSGDMNKFSQGIVFDEDEADRMVKFGINAISKSQYNSGGWNMRWVIGEPGNPFDTAVIMHGLLRLKEFKTELLDQTLERGTTKLKNQQATEIELLKNWRTGNKKLPGKEKADAMDAFTYLVLTEAEVDNKEMRLYLFADRDNLPVYAKVMFAIALHNVKDIKRRDELIKDIDKYLVEDVYNKTTYLKLPPADYRGNWYGSEYETQAFYLKLLTLTEPKSAKTAGVVRYLLINRKNAASWNSSRDTACAIEALGDYLKLNGEAKPNMNLQVYIDNHLLKTIPIKADNLFSFDNKLVLEGVELTAGKHIVKFIKNGTGSLYFNAKITSYSKEDNIANTGKEIKVSKKYYKLVPTNKAADDSEAEKYQRVLLDNDAVLKVGDLAEVEMTVDADNDYEYIQLVDMLPAGFETKEVKTGYNGNEMGAYIEYRDNQTVMYIRTLTRGKHTISYRVRVETPGKFYVLPASISTIYAPELKANSEDWKLGISE